MTRAELGRLREALITVLKHAIELGGSSVSDYVDADGVRGFFQLEHRVYMRTGQPCLVCGTPIARIVVGGRSTHFLSGLPEVRGAPPSLPFLRKVFQNNGLGLYLVLYIPTPVYKRPASSSPVCQAHRIGLERVTAEGRTSANLGHAQE